MLRYTRSTLWGRSPIWGKYSVSYIILIGFLVSVTFISLSQSFAWGRSPIPLKSMLRDGTEGTSLPSESQEVLDVSEHVIEPGDIISITVEGYEEDYNRTAVVQPNGKITYMSLGEIQAAGLTDSQLEDSIREELRPYISSPKVGVSVWQRESVIEPGDIINITVEGRDDYNHTAVVRPNGKISYIPLGEEIQAIGLTASQFQENITAKLQPYISDPKVKVSVERKRARPEEVEVPEVGPEIKPERKEEIEKVELEKKEYLIIPGDVIDIVVREHAGYNWTAVVQPDGKVSYPPLGEIPVAGFTEDQLSQELAAGLSSYVNNPQVNAIVKGREDFGEVEEYLIKPGDVIKIRVERHDDYSRAVMVQSDGKISYPPLGDIPVADLTEDQLSRKLAAGLSSHVIDPQVTTTVLDKKEKYLIKPGDVISITVAGRDNYSQTVVVQSNGKISYSPLGEIQAAGSSPSQLIDSISSGLAAAAKLDHPQVRINVRPFKKIPEEIQRVEVEAPAPLKRFGYNFFTGARNRILRMEIGGQGDGGATARGPAVPSPSVVKDAISGFVGPMDMMDANITATVPSKYILGPGDKITLHFWSDVVEFQTVSLVVDGKGEIVIPKAGKMVVRGMTLAQFQEAAREELTRVAYKNLKLYATLDKLRSIQIFITGEAFRPGSYAVSAVATLSSALYMCGGPNDNGSLRDIRLLRSNETKIVDFYRFLMDGDSSQDFSLDAGDTIFISPVGATVTTSGEVKRPAVYELKEGENLQELTHLAGGIRPSGFLQRVQIDSVDPSRKRIILDVDLSDPDQPNPPVFDGDTVTVFSIPSERMNTITLEGKVRMPGVYQLKEGMRVSDLIESAQGLLGEAYMERADLLRLNPDEKTTKIISINLSKALEGDSDSNVSLKQWDKLVVYSKWDVKWIADRVVGVHGAVQHPGSYERSDGMTIGDLLMQAGGLLPDACPDRVSLLRLDERGRMTRSISVDLRVTGDEPRVTSEEPVTDHASRVTLLKDGDTLLVYTYQEARWEPKREVTIEGAVQNPNVFSRVDGMKVSDLIRRAGGLLPDAYPDRALLLRLDERQRITQGFFISPRLALRDDPRNDLELRDGDKFLVYKYEEAVWEAERQVTVAGAVLDPNVFERVDGMRVSDLLHRAGGPLPNAYLERADIRRFRPDHETYMTIPVNLARALSGDEEANILLEDEDLLTVHTLREAQYKPDNIVTIYGAVQRPDVYVRTVGMKLSDLLFAAGGLLPGAHKDAEIARIDDDGKTFVLTADVVALRKGDESQDILLEDEDVVSVRRQSEFLDILRTVTIAGEVKYPGSYALERNERLSDLIQRTGGLTDRAYTEASVITRKIDYLILEEQKKSMQQVKKLLQDLSQREYQRELARARLIREKHGAETGSDATSSVTIPSATSVSTTGGYVPVVGTIEEAAEAGAMAILPEQAEAAISGIEQIAQPQYTLVTPARKIDSFLPSGRFVVDVGEAVEHPGTKDDIILEDGDVIVIPATPATISVSGAVIQPSSFVYVKGKKVKDYIEMAGGYARDADKDAVYAVKANGMTVRGDKTKLFPGDVIVVPTKVMVQKVTDRLGQVIGAIKFTVTTLATVLTIKLILDRVG